MKQILLLIYLVCVVFLASGYELTSNMALQAVADHRALTEDAGRYYYAPTGEKQLTIPNCLTSGLYLITLLDSGNTIETKQVMIP